MPINTTEFDEIVIEQGSYWRALADVELHCSQREDPETPLTITAGTVLLLQSIRDVDNTAHTIILRPHPAIYGREVYQVCEYRDGKPYSWTWDALTEHRFLVNDFLTKFVLEQAADRVRAGELAAAQEYVRQLQERLIQGQNDPEVMRPILALGVGKWEKEKKLTPKRASYIAEMSTSTELSPALTDKHVDNLKLRIEREHVLATSRADWIKERVAEVGDAVRAILPYMEEQAAAALAHTEDIIRKVGSIQRSVESLDLYIGKGVTVEGICAGKSAPDALPLTITQRKLFMQEEFSVWADISDEFDFKDTAQFMKALVANESLRRQIFPSERSIVCMATRRTEKDYGDPWINTAKNVVNKEVFLLVRDGENLHRVYSPVESHLRALQLFPSRSETDAIFTGVDGSNVNFLDTEYTDKLEKHELIALHYRRFLILLAGLDHRLGLFGKFYDGPKTTKFVSLPFQQAHFRFVHDADGEGMLPKPIRNSLGDWLKENNTYLRSGSRVMCLWDTLANPRTAPGVCKESERRSSGYSWTRHPRESHEVAVVSMSNGELVVYCPTTSSSWRGNGSTVVQSRVSITAWKENYYKRGMGYLVLDAISANELDWYIHDRDSRVNHLDFTRLFKETLAYLREVERQEAPARAALLDALNAGNIGEPSQRQHYVDQAVRTWRAEHRGATLMVETTGSVWTDLLDTMYTIAHAPALALKVLQVASDQEGRPLRFTVTGGNKLVLYVEPSPAQRDDRITPHVWANKLYLEVRKDTPRMVRQQWTILPAATASETTIQEWPEAVQWAGLRSPFPSLTEKQSLLELVNGNSVLESPWLRESVTSEEWEWMFDSWLDAYRRNNRNQSRVQEAHILFPVGVSVHLEKNAVLVLSVRGVHPEVRLWNLANAQQKERLAAKFAVPFLSNTRGRERLQRSVEEEHQSLDFVTTPEICQFPRIDYDFHHVRVLRAKMNYGSSQEQGESLDWRFAAAIRYLNKYQARYEAPFVKFHLNPRLKKRKLDTVFAHYGGPFTITAPPAGAE